MFFGIFVINKVSILSFFVLVRVSIFVLNRVGVWGAGPHLPTQGYIDYPPPGLRPKTPWTKTKTLGLKQRRSGLKRRPSQGVYHPRKDTLFEKLIKSIPWLRQKMIKSIKNPEKRTLAGCTSPLSPYKGVPPPLGVLGLRFWVFVLEHPKRPTVRDENEFRDDPATTDSFSLLPWSSWLVEDAVSGRLEFERLISSWTTCLMIESIVARKYKMAAVR